MSTGVTTHRDGHVLEVTLERGKVNAIDVPTSQALAAAFQELHEDKDLRCAILTGGGDKIFSAGWDLKRNSRPFNEIAESPEFFGVGKLRTSVSWNSKGKEGRIFRDSKDQ